MKPDAALYGLHGLRLRSDVPLAGFPLSPGGHDVDVRWGPMQPVPAHRPPGRLVAADTHEGRYRYVACNDAGGITLRVPEICDFLIDRGLGVVECRPDPAADARFVAVLVAGLAVAFMLTLGGHCVLHASAVEVEGSAIAFAGSSGKGKSTLAALACADGARLVTDDLLRLGTGDTVSCVGGAPQLRLRPKAAWALDRFRPAPPTALTADQRLALWLGLGWETSVPLAVVAAIHPSPGTPEVQLRRLSPVEALVQLTGLTRIVGWEDASVVRQQFHALARAVATVPVVEAVIPWGAPIAEPTVRRMLDLAGQHR